MNILFVNDSPHDAELARAAIERRLPGAEVTGVLDGASFRAISSLDPYDAVVSDWDTGWMDGEELVAALLDMATYGQPVLVFTGAPQINCKHARALGAAMCVDKSMRGYHELAEALHRALTTPRAARRVEGADPYS